MKSEKQYSAPVPTYPSRKVPTGTQKNKTKVHDIQKARKAGAQNRVQLEGGSDFLITAKQSTELGRELGLVF